MIYLINERIHFRPEDGAIWEGSKKESEVAITITMSRLLTLLLKRKGDVVTRDEILDKVWDAHGLRSSNNSLNKYIAELRKVFTSFEVHDEVITTVPRVGFMLSGNIIVDILEEKIDSDITEKDISSVKTVSLSRDFKIDKAFPKVLIWALSVLSLIITFSIPIQFSQQLFNHSLFNTPPLDERKTFSLGTFEQCEIRTIQQSSKEMTNVKMMITKDVINNSGMACLPNTEFYFQPSDPVAYGMPGRVFLSRCTFNKDNHDKFAACKSYYEVNYVFNK